MHKTTMEFDEVSADGVAFYSVTATVEYRIETFDESTSWYSPVHTVEDHVVEITEARDRHGNDIWNGPDQLIIGRRALRKAVEALVEKSDERLLEAAK